MMEPMMVGSPSNTTSPQAGRGVGYLPSFLTGDSFNASPQIQSYGGSFYAGNQPNRIPAYNDRSINFGHSTTIGRNDSFNRSSQKTSAPPIKSLHDSMLAENSSALNLNSSQFKSNIKSMDEYKFGGREQVNQTDKRDLLNQTSPFHSNNETNYSVYNEEPANTNWITVFGFPQNMASDIVDDFRNYGVITKFIVHPIGNWLHIKYKSDLQVKQALAKNGRVVGGSIMIGVKLCTDKEVLSNDTDENSKIFDVAAAMDLANTNVQNQSAISGHPRKQYWDPNSTGPINPMDGSYRDPELSIRTSSVRLPQRSQSFFHQAKKYLNL